MLKRIKIKNIALLDDADLRFDNGLTVLTGETGAGKSVIVTAISLALGARAEREFIRHGADLAVVEAYFDLSNLPANIKVRLGEYLHGNELIIRRSFTIKGSSQAKVNGQNIAVGELRRLTAPLAEIIGQHAGQVLMDEDEHLRFLDKFGSLEALLEKVTESFNEWRDLTAEFARTMARREQLRNERELLLFQQDEISKAEIFPGEQEQLENELRILNSARALMSSASTVRELLSGESNSLVEMLSQARSELEKMAAIDSKLETKTGELAEIGYQLDDIRQFIEQYGSSIEDNPARIEEINGRLDELYNLKKKYGGSEEAVLSTLKEIKIRLTVSPEVDGLILELETKSQRLFERYSKVSLELSSKRRKAGGKLERAVILELSDLAISEAAFQFEFLSEDDSAGVLLGERRVKPQPYGLESGRILFSANPGEPPRSLVKTASGGEISRVLLALKSAEKTLKHRYQPAMIFDEVDAGIGGRTAVEVGKKLKKLSETGQLIVITHLHQIARFADHHFLADKRTDKQERTTITVEQLETSAIPAELDRMVSLPD